MQMQMLDERHGIEGRSCEWGASFSPSLSCTHAHAHAHIYMYVCAYAHVRDAPIESSIPTEKSRPSRR